MAARKKTGRSAAEKAYAKLLEDNTALVGTVGEHYERLRAHLLAAAEEADLYETARSAAVSAGAVTKGQLDQLGYGSVPKLPALAEIGEDSAEPATAKKKPAGGAPAKAAPAADAPVSENNQAPQPADEHSGLEPVPAG
ncbi:Uncharacterised protein [Mycobacteroides abscessus subsp. abscessus]|uniref:hypothetical protein n=1 Tax=Mycobacteroides abscessus TaxID=36809 RepID=UPI00092903BC|nr:hypothetical protein [Mycobacteroides abscessus]SIJ21756.1 Uncharacterised protein [Mycobacteroides abscessus subsp. abscessus]SLH38793.1 Uncharacterised protein [Mycobacteroides abscessus subsp. abscessus]